MKIWVITGCSRGLGRALLERVLESGDAAVGTARDLSTLDDLAAAFPRTLATFALDVTDAAAAHDAVQTAVSAFGRLDVLVNNAGYGHIAPFEQVEEADFRAQIETNLFGVVNLVRAALPVMRSQRDGYIMNVSSIGGRVGAPGLSAYQSAKWAVSGFTESLAQEAAPFGVRVVSIEPGGMRTGWGEIAGGRRDGILPEYDETVGVMLRMMERFVGNEVGDPEKIAKVLFDLSRIANLPYHLVLGSDALQVLEQREGVRTQQMLDWMPVSRSVDFDGGEAEYLADVAFK